MLPAVNCSLEGAQAGSGQLLCWACRGKVSAPSQICLEQLPQHRHTTRSPTQISWIKPLYFIFLSVVWCWTWAPVNCPLCPTMLQCWAGWKHQSNMNGCLGQLYRCLTQPLILETHASTSSSKAKIGSLSVNPLRLCSSDSWFGLCVPGCVFFPLLTKPASTSSDRSTSLCSPWKAQLLTVNV